MLGSCAGCIGKPAKGKGCGAGGSRPCASGKPRPRGPSKSSSNIGKLAAVDDGGKRESIGGAPALSASPTGYTAQI